jgi:hypothetical protein
VRVSLNTVAKIGICSKCKAEGVWVLGFMLLVDGHYGDAEPLCSTCLMNCDGQKTNVPMHELAPGPAPRKKALRSNQRSSLRQELDIQEEWGARRQPGSGNQAGTKGDNRKKGELRIEAKFTQAESFSLKLDELYKIAGEATHGELAVLFIDFLTQGTGKLKDRFAVLHSNDLKELYAASQNRRSERPT